MSDTIKGELKKLDQELTAKEKEIATITQAPRVLQAPTWWTTTNAMTMSSAVLLFGVFTLVLALIVLTKGYKWEAVLKIFGTVLIIVLTVFLIVAGYSDNQIAPAVGLMGTIAGYLLGKDAKEANTGVSGGGSTSPSPKDGLGKPVSDTVGKSEGETEHKT